MEVILKHNTPLHVTAEAIRTCWASQGKSDTQYSYSCNFCHSKNILIDNEAGHSCNDCESDIIVSELSCGPKDKELIHRVGNKFKHASTLEHLSYTFWIDGISRACLQELARHRHTSLSVKSTRYTLKELKDEYPFIYHDPFNPNDGVQMPNDKQKERASKYLVFTGDEKTDYASILGLNTLRELLSRFNTSNDIAKYCLPESYKTALTWTINARSLQNFLALRTSKTALWEIRNLANAIFEAIPEDHKYLFEEYLDQNKTETITLTKEEHDKLLEFKFMYEDLCK